MARILVVDDDQPTRVALRVALGSAGHEVIEASSGHEGIRLYCEHPADIVLLDLVMPEKDGFETIRELRRNFPDVRVIAISAHGQHYLQIAEGLGAVGMLAKPFKPEEVLEAVREALASGITRILLIEDDDMVRNMLAEVLKGVGYEVTEAVTGEEGVQLYRSNPADAIITDIMLPLKSGLEFIEEVRKEFSKAKIIAISAYHDSYLQEARKLGANAILKKPFSMKALLDEAKKLAPVKDN